jgi:transcriptional regulator with GAF, ATPase, and Fis domain
LLVHFLVNKFALRIGKQFDGVSAATMQRLMEYSWPGNIRELENVLERAIILVTGGTLEIGSDLLPRSSPALAERQPPDPESTPFNCLLAVPQPTAGKGQPSLEAVEHNYILTVLQQANWVITGPRGAARILDLHPSTLRNRMKKLGITRASHHIW